MPGVQELLVIAVVALLVFGPERLPEVARNLGRITGRVRRELRRNVDDLKTLTDIDELTNEFRDVSNEFRRPNRRARPTATSRPRSRDEVFTQPVVRDTPPPIDMDAT